MSRCEDFPCCGHYDQSTGESWCPSNGIFPCAICGSTDPRTASSRSSICLDCQEQPGTFHDNENCPGCSVCDPEPEERFCPECGAGIDPDDFGCTQCDVTDEESPAGEPYHGSMAPEDIDSDY